MCYCGVHSRSPRCDLLERSVCVSGVKPNLLSWQNWNLDWLSSQGTGEIKGESTWGESRYSECVCVHVCLYSTVYVHIPLNPLIPWTHSRVCVCVGGGGHLQIPSVKLCMIFFVCN